MSKVQSQISLRDRISNIENNLVHSSRLSMISSKLTIEPSLQPAYEASFSAKSLAEKFKNKSYVEKKRVSPKRKQSQLIQAKTPIKQTIASNQPITEKITPTSNEAKPEVIKSSQTSVSHQDVLSSNVIFQLHGNLIFDLNDLNGRTLINHYFEEDKLILNFAELGHQSSSKLKDKINDLSLDYTSILSSLKSSIPNFIYESDPQFRFVRTEMSKGRDVQISETMAQKEIRKLNNLFTFSLVSAINQLTFQDVKIQSPAMNEKLFLRKDANILTSLDIFVEDERELSIDYLVKKTLSDLNLLLESKFLSLSGLFEISDYSYKDNMHQIAIKIYIYTG